MFYELLSVPLIFLLNDIDKQLMTRQHNVSSQIFRNKLKYLKMINSFAYPTTLLNANFFSNKTLHF